MDTCGLCAPGSLEKVLPYTDLILYDLKEIDPAKHREFTGQDNRRILDNLLLLRDYLAAHPGSASLWIRTPLIPGATANRETIERVGKFIRDNLDGAVQRWELCAFNNLCRDKYRRLDLEWQYRCHAFAYQAGACRAGRYRQALGAKSRYNISHGRRPGGKYIKEAGDEGQ